MASRNILFLLPRHRRDAFTATATLGNIIEEDPKATITLIGHPEHFVFYEDAPAQLRFLPYDDLTRFGQKLSLAGQTLGRIYHRIVAMGNDRLPYFLWAKHRHLVTFQPDSFALPHLFYEDENGAEFLCPPVLWSGEKRHLPLPDTLADDAPLIVVTPGEAARAQWTGKLYAELAWRLSDTDETLANAHMVVLGDGAGDPQAAEIVADIEKNIPAGQRTIMRDLPFNKQVVLMQRARVVLGSDRLMARVAAAAGAPLIILFDQHGETPETAQPGRPYSLYSGVQAVDLAAFLASELAKPATSGDLSDNS